MIWLVSELYYPEETSTGYFVTRIAEGLARDVDVGVLCAQPTYSARGVRAPVREDRRGVRVHRCRSTTFPKDNLVLRALNMLTLSFSILLAALRRFRKGDVVIAVTNPPLLPLVCAAACRIRSARFVLLVHDVYPEVLSATGAIRRGGRAERWLASASRAVISRADSVVVIGRDMARLLAAKGAKLAGSIQVIPNWADVDEVKPLPRGSNRLLEGLGIDSEFVVQYAGNMGRTHDLDVILAAARLLQAEASIRILFVGWGGGRKSLEERVERLGERVALLPHQPRERLGELLNACDVSVIAFRGGMAGVSVPSRMYNALAAGKPIIAVTEPWSELALLVKEENVGWIVPPGDAEGLAAVIRDARSDRGRLSAMGRRAREVAVNRCGFESVLGEYRCLAASLGVAFPRSLRRPDASHSS